MAKKKYKVNILSKSSVDKLKQDLLKYKNDVDSKLVIFCEKLAELGVQAAQGSVVSLDAVFTGDLFNSIHSEEISRSKNRVVFAVVADSSHAIYVEVGTGLIGAESQYPGNPPVTYAQGKTIRQLADGRYGWFYQRGEQWYFTEGMPSRPFMYFASIEMQEKIVKIAKEVFS